MHFVIHSTRKNFSYSVVFLDEQNEYLYDAKTALKIYREELAKRALAYTQNTGQKLQKNTATILSAIVNLEQHHTLKDLQPILDKLEQDLDTKIISASIHRDEGTLVNKKTGKMFFSGIDFALNRQDNKLYWIDRETKNFLEPVNLEQFDIKKNYHAHIEFLGIDTQGRAIKRNRLHIHYHSKLQDFVTETLRMERGRKGSRNKHKDPHKFKEEGVIKREAQAELEKTATIKALKEINKQIRAQLQEKKAQRPHYAKWEAYYKELQEYVKTEKPTMGEVMELIGNFVGELLTDIAQLQQQLQALQNAPAPEPQVIVKEDTQKIEELEEQLEEEKSKNAELAGLLKKQEEEIERLKAELDKLKQLRYIERKKHQEEIQELREQLREAKENYAKLQNAHNSANTKQQLGQLLTRYTQLIDYLDNSADIPLEEEIEINEELDRIEEILREQGISIVYNPPPSQQKRKKRNPSKGLSL